jgi:hypothetical protein
MVIAFFTSIGCNYQRPAIIHYCDYDHVSVFWMETGNTNTNIFYICSVLLYDRFKYSCPPIIDNKRPKAANI